MMWSSELLSLCNEKREVLITTSLHKEGSSDDHIITQREKF
jgi:hypothetical protein